MGSLVDRRGKDAEIAGLRQELADLEAAIALQDPALSEYTMGIALAKIAKLREQIKEVEG